MRRVKKGIYDVNKKINELMLVLERLRLREYLEYLNSPKKVIWRGFISGVAKGFGAAIGFALLGALVIYLLHESFLNNIPLIGDLVAKIMAVANAKLGIN